MGLPIPIVVIQYKGAEEFKKDVFSGFIYSHFGDSVQRHVSCLYDKVD